MKFDFHPRPWGCKIAGNHHNTPDPYHAKQKPIGRWSYGTGDRPPVNRFDRIERKVRWLIWMVAFSIVQSLVLLAAGCQSTANGYHQLRDGRLFLLPLLSAGGPTMPERALFAEVTKERTYAPAGVTALAPPAPKYSFDQKRQPALPMNRKAEQPFPVRA